MMIYIRILRERLKEKEYEILLPLSINYSKHLVKNKKAKKNKHELCVGAPLLYEFMYLKVIFTQNIML